MNLQTSLTMIHLDSSGTHFDSFQDPIVVVLGINEDTSQAIREAFPVFTGCADFKQIEISWNIYNILYSQNQLAI